MNEKRNSNETGAEGRERRGERVEAKDKGVGALFGERQEPNKRGAEVYSRCRWRYGVRENEPNESSETRSDRE